MIVIPTVISTPSQVSSDKKYIPTGSEATWSVATAYVTGDIREYNVSNQRRCYRAKSNHTGQTPAPGGTAYWDEISYGGWRTGVTFATSEYAEYLGSQYQASQNALSKDPTTEPTFWTRVGTTPGFEPFNHTSSQGVSTTSPHVYTVTPGVTTDSVALFGLDNCSTVRIQANSTAGGGSIYDSTLNLEDNYAGNWYAAVYGSNRYLSKCAVFDVPQYSDTVYTITLTAPSGSVSVGFLVVGLKVSVGDTADGIVSDLANYSEVSRDLTTGVASVTLVPNVPISRQALFLDKSLAPFALDAREDLNGVGAAWSGLDDQTSHAYYEAALQFGFYRRFVLKLQSNSVNIDLEIESL